MAIEIKKEWEGRMGQNLHPVFEGYVDGKLVAITTRKWLTVAIAKAVAAGHISADGDTTSSFAKWAAINAPTLYDRMPENL